LIHYYTHAANGALLSVGNCPSEEDLLLITAPEGGGVQRGEAKLNDQYWNGDQLIDLTVEQLSAYQQFPVRRTEFDFQTCTWPDIRTLEGVKALAWFRIKETRDAFEFGGMTVADRTFDTDTASQARIQGAVQLASMAGEDFEIDWTLADNSTVTLARSDLMAVGLALGNHVQFAHRTARTLRQQIEAAESIDEAESITWPSSP